MEAAEGFVLDNSPLPGKKGHFWDKTPRDLPPDPLGRVFVRELDTIGPGIVPDCPRLSPTAGGTWGRKRDGKGEKGLKRGKKDKKRAKKKGGKGVRKLEKGGRKGVKKGVKMG